jgi:hypothetical protein
MKTGDETKENLASTGAQGDESNIITVNLKRRRK